MHAQDWRKHKFSNTHTYEKCNEYHPIVSCTRQHSTYELSTVADGFVHVVSPTARPRNCMTEKVSTFFLIDGIKYNEII